MIFFDREPPTAAPHSSMPALLVISPRAFNERTGLVIGFPVTLDPANADNPFAVPLHSPNDEIAYALAFRPTSFHWRSSAARPHPWGRGHTKALARALELLNLICGIVQP